MGAWFCSLSCHTLHQSWNMAKHFTSVLKVVADKEEGALTASDPSKLALEVDTDESLVRLPPAPPPSTLQGQPRPPTPSKELVSLRFDKIFPPATPPASLYKQSVREVVENVLLGYHGTVIALSSSETSPLKTKSLWDTSGGLIQRALRQMFRCLKKSKKSKSKASASKLVILCSYAIVIEEDVRDLLCGLKRDPHTGHLEVSTDPNLDVVMPPKLEVSNGQIRGLTHHTITTTSEVATLLKYGKKMEQNVLKVYSRSSSSVEKVELKPKGSAQEHHALFTLSVEFNQFGSMNAPVSGNLLFADLAVLDPLASRQRFMKGEAVDKQKRSLFTFAKTVESLSSNIATLESADLSAKSAFSDEATHTLPNIPSPENSNLHKQSVLTQLIEDSLGGNCKTLLLTYMPSRISPYLHRETMEGFKLASRARILQNTPNKRDLAEKALMSAYLRGLEEVYGQGVRAQEEEVEPEVLPEGPEVQGKKLSLSDSVSSGEMDDAYEEMIDKTKGEERQKHMEMAATALVAATLQDKEGDSEGSGSDTDNEAPELSENENENTSSTSSHGSAMKDKKLPRVNEQEVKTTKGSGVLILLNEEQNVTLEALVGILQDPDDGVPRPSATALQNVRIKKDAGALFSGAAIVKWLKENISGVKSEADAQLLGQMLLDSGHIFHSEGSSVFADAETLFYYARYARNTRRFLSLDEIQSLLNTAATQATPPREEDSVTMPHPQTQKTDHNESDVQMMSLEDSGLSNSESSKLQTLSKESGVAIKSEGTKKEESSSVQVGIESCEDDSVQLKNEADGVEGGGIHGLGSDGVQLKNGAEISHVHWKNTADVDGEMTAEDVDEGATAREEWMNSQDSEEEDLEDNFKSADPNIEYQQRIPSLHKLESTVNYPHPLHMAAAIGKRSGVIRELVMMFGVNKLDNSRRTPLMFAALGNNKSSSCSTLLRCSADVNAQDTSGLTALHVACYHGNVSAASILLSHEASVASTDNKGHTALHWSMIPESTGCLELLMRCLLQSDLLNHPDKSGLTAVHWSIFYNHPKHLTVLLKKHRKSGQVDLIELDSHGRTYVIYAIQKNSPACLKVLLTAEPSLLNLPGHVPADFAPIDAEASLPTLPESVVSFPIHFAAIQDTTDTLDAILEFVPPRGSSVVLDVDKQDQEQWTSLHYAVAYNRLEAARALVRKGARVDVKDGEGKTVMDYVLELPTGKEEMLAILKNESIAEEGEPSERNGAKGTPNQHCREEPTKQQQQQQKRSRICNLL